MGVVAVVIGWSGNAFVVFMFVFVFGGTVVAGGVTAGGGIVVSVVVVAAAAGDGAAGDFRVFELDRVKGWL